ncbi:MAG TPA: hypothetical protein VII35_09725 [Steroidobacteraceae bacterium]
MKLVDMLTSRLAMGAAKTDPTPDSNDRTDSGLAAAAEYWAGRAVWVLVIMISLWDIAVTFDKPLLLTARLF